MVRHAASHMAQLQQQQQRLRLMWCLLCQWRRLLTVQCRLQWRRRHQLWSLCSLLSSSTPRRHHRSARSEVDRRQQRRSVWRRRMRWRRRLAAVHRHHHPPRHAPARSRGKVRSLVFRHTLRASALCRMMMGMVSRRRRLLRMRKPYAWSMRISRSRLQRDH